MVANDICPFAHEALLLNMELNNSIPNGVISFHQENKLVKSKEYFDQYDIIMCGDMLYDADFSLQLKKSLCQHKIDGHIWRSPAHLLSTRAGLVKWVVGELLMIISEMVLQGRH